MKPKKHTFFVRTSTGAWREVKALDRREAANLCGEHGDKDRLSLMALVLTSQEYRLARVAP